MHYKNNLFNYINSVSCNIAQFNNTVVILYIVTLTKCVQCIVSFRITKSAARLVSHDIVGHTCARPSFLRSDKCLPPSVLSLSTLIEVRHLFCWVTHSGIHVVREITYYMPVTKHCYSNKIR